MMYWLADGDPIRLMQLGKMGMVDYFWMLNKKIAEEKRKADALKKQKKYG